MARGREPLPVLKELAYFGSDNIEAIPEAQVDEQAGRSYDCRVEARTLSWLLKVLSRDSAQTMHLITSEIHGAGSSEIDQ